MDATFRSDIPQKSNPKSELYAGCLVIQERLLYEVYSKIENVVISTVMRVKKKYGD